MSPLELAHASILASAGSGKTYALVQRYLRLLGTQADVRSILASTFTRAAAGEILHRLLRQLAEAARDELKRRELGEMLGGPVSRQQVVELLLRLTSQLHRLQVRTLDSLFASLVQCFALELGLPPHAGIIDEAVDARLRRQAIQDMLEEEPREQMIDLLSRLTQGGSEKAVTKLIDRAVSGLYPLYLESREGAWQCVPAPEKLEPAVLARAIRRLLEQPQPAHKSLMGAMARDIAHAEAGDWKGFVSKGLGRVVATGARTFSRATIDEALVRVYRPLVQHARGVLLGRLAPQARATWALLDHFHRHYVALKRRERALTFADLARLAGAVVQRAHGEGGHDLSFRLDGGLDHLLLDEMQDTSVQQWHVLEPLARAIVAARPPGRSFFCVGDVKQSIYGWRDAAPEILQSLPDLLRGPGGEKVLTTQPLDRSWRSAPAVIDAVNRVFSTLSGNPAMEGAEEAALLFGATFHVHSTVMASVSGCVELRVARTQEGDEGGNPNARRLAEAAELVRALDGRPWARSIGVLCRTNAGVARVLYELNRIDVLATERGGMPLTNTPPVNAVLDLLHLADHPGDTVAAFHVANSPLGPLVGLSSHDAGRSAVAASVRRAIAGEGLAEIIRRWAEGMAPSCSARDLRRLVQLVELAGRHEAQSPSLRSGDFIALVEETNVADASPSRIEVMTIHQSKGLEFDAVVLPELESTLAGEHPPPVVFEREGTSGPVTRICPYIESELRALAPEFDGMFQAQKTRIVRESLCLLYVAMTRARRGLYMFVDPARSARKRLAGVLIAGLCPGRSEAPQGEVIARIGDESWADVPPPGAREEQERPASPPRDERLADAPLAPTARPGPGRAARRRTAARRLSGATVRDFLQPLDPDATDRGAALHGLFERVEWIEAFQPDAPALRRVVRRTVPRRDEGWVQRMTAEFLALLQAGAVRACLSPRCAADEMACVWRERPYAHLGDDVEVGRIDRLHAWYRRGEHRPVRAAVIDFKTDDIDATAVPAAAERHRAQLEAYRTAAAEQLELDLSHVEMRILFLTPAVLHVLEA